MSNNIKDLGKHKPEIGERVYVSKSAEVIGKVILGNDSSIWFKSVVRGDVDKITIGEKTNIQDGCVLHVSNGFPLEIGSGVTVGHKVVLHGCKIEDHCLIGIGAIINDGAVIGKGSVVAAGSVIPPGKIYEENSLIMGAPAKVKRSLTNEEQDKYHFHFERYIETKNYYLENRVY